MVTTSIQAGPEISVKIDVMRDEVLRYSKSGDNLIIDLKSGDQIVVNDFYTFAENQSLHSLVFGDGTASGVTGDPATAAGLGMGFSEEGVAAAVFVHAHA